LTAIIPTLTVERLRKILFYAPETGLFTRNIGGIAGSLRKDGYWWIMIDGQRYFSHRLAWFYMTGEWPIADLDHKNSNKSDNRWANLRQASRSQNNSNARIYKNNTSGFKGVSWHKARGKWVARIMVDKRSFSLGYFDSAEEAYSAYCIAAPKYHGEFARVA
jgi:hypothetical protein